ncbi:MAG: hypothetical protein PUA61_08195 [Succinatimonas hippei]|nr:hypothetical protein [Succinatimonas hippei]
MIIRSIVRYGSELAVCGLFAFHGYAWLYLLIVLFGAIVMQGVTVHGR